MQILYEAFSDLQPARWISELAFPQPMVLQLVVNTRRNGIRGSNLVKRSVGAGQKSLANTEFERRAMHGEMAIIP